MKSFIVSTIFLFGMFCVVNASADELVHTFKNPSFNGIGYSAHMLTMENQEKSRKEKLKAEREAELAAAERDNYNSTLNKFLRNFESRVYSQLSRELVNQLFGEEASESGEIELQGSIITYSNDGDMITLTTTDPNGNLTSIEIPIGDFGI
jgi:curli production assembly/transport component CsgF